MIGIREDDRSAEFFQRLLRQRLNGRRGADRHKRRRLNHSMWSAQLPAPRRRRRIRLLYRKRKAHALSVSGENPRPTYAANHINGPHAECNRERFAPPQLLRIRSRKADGQQDQRPE